jgi:hypothetical protein
LAAKIDVGIPERLRKGGAELRIGKRNGPQIEEHRRSAGD